MGFLGKMLGIMPKKQPVHVDDTNFAQEVLQSKVPVVLDVWGAQCAPCKKLEPIIMELAAKYDGRVKVCEMLAQNAPRAATQLSIMATPTVVYLKGGREVERVSGFRGSVYHQQTIAEVFDIHD